MRCHVLAALIVAFAIFGRVSPATPIGFVAYLTGSSVVPTPSRTSASGNVALTINSPTNATGYATFTNIAGAYLARICSGWLMQPWACRLA